LPLTIVGEVRPNSFEFETSALIKASGFREYDARWWFGHPGSTKAPELNLIGVQALGMGLGTLIRRLGVGPDIVTGHDFRSYSLSIKLALVSGLMAAGAWQCVAAVDALGRGEYSAAVVSIVGCNQQAIAAQFSAGAASCQ